MANFANRVRETSTTTGSGAVSLAGAVVGFRTFVAGVGDGTATVPYAIVGRPGEACEGQWEMGLCTVTAGTPDSITRDSVEDSSNAGALVTFAAGTKDVFITPLASLLNAL